MFLTNRLDVTAPSGMNRSRITSVFHRFTQMVPACDPQTENDGSCPNRIAVNQDTPRTKDVEAIDACFGDWIDDLLIESEA